MHSKYSLIKRLWIKLLTDVTEESMCGNLYTYHCLIFFKDIATKNYIYCAHFHLIKGS